MFGVFIDLSSFFNNLRYCFHRLFTGIKHNQLHKVLYSFYLLCLLKWKQAASQKPNTSSRLQASSNSLSSFAKQNRTNWELPRLWKNASSGTLATPVFSRINIALSFVLIIIPFVRGVTTLSRSSGENVQSGAFKPIYLGTASAARIVFIWYP